ncbi:hypothetical protein H0B56_08105 [Haloechinothrix sp. YIM 98757]|uniref:Uncharacterized protein n=1 Tax=Haloechinothrix aidingensis TaxID=2752311 RepID=A0A838A9N6_9PSEU|nr:hypothetical protein [Haloechinothrix aidingensis]MBA0125501.1 hypothetical protein [Haloechinothrix aidingensis]
MLFEWIVIVGVLLFVAVRVVINLQDRPSTEKSGSGEHPREELAKDGRRE